MARGKLSCPRLPGGQNQRCQHLAEILGDQPQGRIGAWYLVAPIGQFLRPGHGVIKAGIGHPGGQALGTQGSDRQIGMIGMRARGLQQREQVFHPIIGGQCRVYQGRKQQLLFAEGADNQGFLGHRKARRAGCKPGKQAYNSL